MRVQLVSMRCLRFLNSKAILNSIRPRVDKVKQAMQLLKVSGHRAFMPEQPLLAVGAAGIS